MAIRKKTLLVLRGYKGEPLADQELPNDARIKRGESVFVKGSTFLVREIDHGIYSDGKDQIYLNLHHAYLVDEKNLDAEKFSQRSENEWTEF